MVIKLVILVLICSVSCFVKFGYQTSKTVHDIQKFYIETTSGVYECFIAFFMFFLDEIDVVGPKLEWEHILVGKF